MVYSIVAVGCIGGGDYQWLLCLAGEITLLLWNILPVNSIQILSFLVIASILLLMQLVLLNIELGLFLDPRLVGGWAYDDVYVVDKFRPMVELTLSKHSFWRLPPESWLLLVALMPYCHRVFLDILGWAWL